MIVDFIASGLFLITLITIVVLPYKYFMLKNKLNYAEKRCEDLQIMLTTTVSSEKRANAAKVVYLDGRDNGL